MKRVFAFCLISAIGYIFAGSSNPALGQFNRVRDEGTVYSPNAFKVPYLGVDGAFTVDTKEISAIDPRNPKRIVFQKMEFFSFYKDLDGFTPIAEQCRYVGCASDNGGVS